MRTKTTLFKLEEISGYFSWSRTNFVEYCEVLATYNEPSYSAYFYNETLGAVPQLLIYGTKESIKTFFEWHIQHDDLYCTKRALLGGIVNAFDIYSEQAFQREFLLSDWFLDMFKSLYEEFNEAEHGLSIKHLDSHKYVHITVEELYELLRARQSKLNEELHEKFKPGGSEYENIKTHFTETANEH